jgi:hypothetical protein
MKRHSIPSAGTLMWPRPSAGTWLKGPDSVNCDHLRFFTEHRDGPQIRRKAQGLYRWRECSPFAATTSLGDPAAAALTVLGQRGHFFEELLHRVLRRDQSLNFENSSGFRREVQESGADPFRKRILQRFTRSIAILAQSRFPFRGFEDAEV